MSDIDGYNYGHATLARSPVTCEELELLKRTLMFGPDDERYLKMAGSILESRVEDVLDLWYGYSPKALSPVGSSMLGIVQPYFR